MSRPNPCRDAAGVWWLHPPQKKIDLCESWASSHFYAWKTQNMFFPIYIYIHICKYIWNHIVTQWRILADVHPLWASWKTWEAWSMDGYGYESQRPLPGQSQQNSLRGLSFATMEHHRCVILTLILTHVDLWAVKSPVEAAGARSFRSFPSRTSWKDRTCPGFLANAAWIKNWFK